MMVEFKWISLFLTAVLQFTAAAETLRLNFTVRVGDEVTLPCENVIDGQQKCEYTTWLFSGLGNTAAVELVNLGQIGGNAKAKSDRLSVTEKCCLVIKKVIVEDVGRYTCRQFRGKGGPKLAEDSLVPLSVIIMTEHQDTDKVTLNCSVSTYERCRPTTTVKWLLKGKDVDKDNQALKTSQSPCNASVSFLTSHYIYTSMDDVFSCEVTDGNKVQKFPFRLQPSSEKPGDDIITTTENRIKAGITTTASSINDDSTGLNSNWWLYVLVSVVLAALLIIIVKVIRWKKANKTGMNDNVGLTSDSAVTESAPENSQDKVDPEDGVSYAAVSFTNKNKSKGRVQSKNDADEGDAVTYTTVKASSADPSNLYATIN